MSSINDTSFTKWYQKLWSIQSFELKKIVPLLFLKFFISFIYAILTCLKDTLVVTAQGSGAEVIPVLKGWIILPMAVIAALCYSKLCNHFRRTTIFYGIITTFLLFLLFFAFYLFPNREVLSPYESANWLTNLIGSKYSHWISIYRNWIPSLFFVTAELWGQLVIFLLFWGFTNQITRIGEAKRTYTLFIAAGDLASMFTGYLVLHYVKKYSGVHFYHTLQSLILYICLFGCIIMGIFWYLNKYVLTDTKLYNPLEIKKIVNRKTKLSLINSIKHIGKSQYLLCIAILVIGCALTINMVEVTWKAHLKMLYPKAADYQAFIASITKLIGFIALITVLFLGSSTMRIFGWHFTAQLTPILVGVTGFIFFILVINHSHLSFVTKLFGVTPLMFLVIFGAFQNVTSKALKYSFFDSTKEMAYIPLDEESKVKGKAAIDVVGSRFGKSGSSWIQVAMIDLIGTSGSVLTITPYLMPIIGITVVGWMLAARFLNKEFTKDTVKAEVKPAA